MKAKTMTRGSIGAGKLNGLLSWREIHFTGHCVAGSYSWFCYATEQNILYGLSEIWSCSYKGGTQYVLPMHVLDVT